MFTANLQYSLSLLEVALVRFVEGLPIECFVGWRWPLSPLFTLLDALTVQTKALIRNEDLMREFREQLLRQEREAAALEERNRIARDLHDSIKQQLFGISMSAAAVKTHWHRSTQDAEEALEDIQRSAKEAQVEMVALLQQLRASPLENTNLANALQTQAQALGYRTGAQVQVTIEELPPTDRLPATAQETVFRIVQEAFANISRHARASTIILSLYQKDDALVLDIEDDGQGFDPARVQKGMGLSNLRERAVSLHGTLQIESAPSRGTSIHLSLPLLDTLSMREKRAREELEIKRASEQASWYLQLGQNVALITVVLLSLGGSFAGSSLVLLLAFLSIGILCYACLNTHFTITRIAFYRGEDEQEVLSLRQREQGMWLWLLGLLLAGCWSTGIFLLSRPLPFLWEIELALTLVLLFLYGLMRRRRSMYLNRFFEKLPGQRLRWEMEERRRRIVRMGRGWLAFLAVDVVVYLRTMNFSLPPPTARDWVSYGLTVLLLLYGALILLDWQQLRCWQNLLTARLVQEEGNNG
ncbi:hypothetical protein KDA_48250 [Dictyobacter alpinus]|uniref:Histidine kinase domain-containing protein n=1 Tax=Dictyobacter alpinus TaxID=2014873 RepID=A0A402BD66_9CHLR|nr:hypothetical protein KDA_48250 [Dictyobacter alpinus]